MCFFTRRSCSFAITRIKLNKKVSRVTTIRDFTYNFDSVHNELLQRLFETGIAGFLCYYGMIAMACVRAFRSGADRRIAAAAAAFAVLAYNVQSFVNISVPIVLPLNLLFTGVAAAAGREDHGEER